MHYIQHLFFFLLLLFVRDATAELLGQRGGIQIRKRGWCGPAFRLIVCAPKGSLSAGHVHSVYTETHTHMHIA